MKARSALLYAPAAALALLAGYEGVAEAAEGAKEPVPVLAAAADDGRLPWLVTGSVDGYVEELAAAAVHAAAYRDMARLEGLFAPSIRAGCLSGPLSGLLAFMRGSISETGVTEVYRGARAYDGPGLRYEYVNACVSGIRAGTRSYEMRLSVFVDGLDAERNRGIATMSVADMSMSPSDSRPRCVNVGYLPVC